MKLTIITALFAVLGCLAAAQSVATEKYPLSEVQKLRLQNKQMAAQLAQVAYQNAQANLNSAYNDLIQESAKVKKENSWKDSVKFDLAHVTFCDKLDAQGACIPEPAGPTPTPAPESAKPAPAPKPEDKK